MPAQNLKHLEQFFSLSQNCKNRAEKSKSTPCQLENKLMSVQEKQRLFSSLSL